ncbi:glycosyltransferase [Paenibacillus sp. OV219]|uniref:glycosyltransferase n=1 Tax=Paenibacillus sp. OV219 TaxID=1884377 RepID=UPI0008B43CB1|nr:glycosyltransferase [Paenibacillus sp. OV219]SEN61611.1 Glycosyltransferase involved in cell wall bisynthesis [Paenibacillus sp. OV219]
MHDEKIVFHDTANDGHRFIYNYTVMSNLKGKEIHYYSPLDDELQKNELKSKSINIIDTDKKKAIHPLLSRVRDLFELSRYCKKNKIKRIFFFNLDSVILPLVLLFPLFINKEVSGTLHWFPGRSLKQKVFMALINFKVINKVIVHGHYTYNSIISANNKMTDDLLKNINYPNLHDNKNEVNASSTLNNYAKPVLLAFGGTRFDKGLDILLQALQHINKQDFTLIIAGKAEDFSENDIEQMINEYGLNGRVIPRLGYVNDNDVVQYFSSADIVVLPYRKIFTGQSGPLTEGIMNNKFIIGPSHGEIGFTIKSYGLGDVFESENIESLTSVLLNTLQNFKDLNEKNFDNQQYYKQLISKESFIEEYRSFFKVN